MISNVKKSTMAPRRLHPLVMLFSTLKIFRDMMIPLAILLFSRLTQKNVETTGVYMELAIFGGLILLFVIYGFIHWRTYTYRVEEGEFRVEQGVIKKEKSYISLQRIQSIDFTESIIHQIFGVVKVQIQTAGGAKPEVQLTAVLKSEAERLKQELLSLSNHSNEVTVQETKVKESIVNERTITNGELMMAGLTSGKIGVILSAIIALGSQLPNMLGDISITSLLPEGMMHGDALTIVVYIAVGFAITWFLSVIYTIIIYGNFVIEKKEDQLFITYGLLERKHLTISLARIQAVKVVEGLLRQPFGFVTLQLVSAGGMINKKEKLDILFPLMKRKEVRKFLENLSPGLCGFLGSETFTCTSSQSFYLLEHDFCVSCYRCFVLVFSCMGSSIFAFVTGYWNSRSFKIQRRWVFS